MGGTFGCVGNPLEPMPASEFIKKLATLQTENLNQIHYLAAPSIKDSTELTAYDWLLLAEFIQELSLDFQHFIIIHGTDTLSYASAFLHHIFKQSLRIIFTGSQQPFLTADGLNLLDDSDASDNLNYALTQIQTCTKGVYLGFANTLHPAHQSYKQHTESFNAFISKDEKCLTPFLNHQIIFNHHLIEKSKNIRCLNLYLYPETSKNLRIDLNNIAKNPPQILILQGFGSGNLPYSSELESTLKQLIEQEVWVIISTQVLFGAITQKYATGSWLNNINLVFDPHYSQSDLYARAVLLYLQYGDQKNWQQYWV